VKTVQRQEQLESLGGKNNETEECIPPAITQFPEPVLNKRIVFVLARKRAFFKKSTKYYIL
jgi:hypothetical protein